MTMTQPDPLESLGRDDLLRICRRDRMVKEMMASRLAAVISENAELMAIVQDLQTALQQSEAPGAPNGDATASEGPTEGSAGIVLPKA